MEHGKENPPAYIQAPYPPALAAQYPHPSNAHTNPPNNSEKSVVQNEAHQLQQVIIIGGCPKCRVGVLEDEFTLCGWCCCFWCFPLGVIFLWSMREKRCINCHEIFRP